MMRCHAAQAAVAGLLIALSVQPATATNGYYRGPTVQGSLLVFASEGDLWKAALDGGQPVRITTHVEEESAPALSPDGRLLAFNGHYDGPREVYVMPLVGGSPQQLTFEGGGASVVGWTPDGRVLYRSTRVPGPRKKCVLRAIDPEGGSVESLPLLDATDAAYAGDSETVFFTRFGLALTGDHTRQYRGGLMAQLWRYRLGSDEEAVRLAEDFGAPIRHPMYWDGRVYFVTDKSGDDNLWSLNEAGEDPQQHTDFRGWELSTPTLAEGVVYYQRGADLYRYDLEDETESKLELQIVTDRDDSRIRWIDRPLEYLDSARAGGQGESAALTARGRVAVVFPGSRRRVELAIPVEARARSAVVGPKGQWVYLVLDQDRFGEVWRYPADGLGAPERLTEEADSHIWGVYPSPDGERVLFDDKKKRLWTVDVKSRIKGLLETAKCSDDDPFGGFAWSDDGRYVAYTVNDPRSLRRVVLRDFENGRRQVVTTGKYESFAPAISPDCQWLYFVSNRRFSPSPSSPWGDRNLGTSFDRRGKLYALQLQPGARFPFDPLTELADDLDDLDEGIDEDSKDESDKEAAKESDGEEPTDDAKETEVVLEGVADRLWAVPFQAGNYRGLAVTDDFLYVLERADGQTDLKSLSIDAEDPETETYAEEVAGFSLSLDRKTVFFQTGRGRGASFSLAPASAKAPKDLSGQRLRVGDWRLGVVPRDEWRQMLLDAWRLHREFAFDAHLRGVDWDALIDKYLPLVDRVGHREELSDLLGQMVGELGILHSQVRGGDQPSDEESGSAAALGAEYEPVEGGLRITLIYDGERHRPDTLGPLRKPGVEVQVNDILTAVNGRAVETHAELAYALQSRAGQQVRLDLLRDGEERAVVVVPIRQGAASALPYQHWVQQNRERVAEASDGRIGYLHLRAMGSADMASYVRDFYEHYDKGGVILDVRGNGGGNIDSWLLGNLLRRVWAFWSDPAGGPPEGNMQQAFRGHLVVLIDEGTYSDGETFSAGIKALDLAPTIGTRTAGAGIWLTGRNRLIDRGVARVAEFAQHGLDGRWLIEGRGVAPDTEVVNPPKAAFLGEDTQLDAALDHLAERLDSEPIPKLRAKPLPPFGEIGRDVE